MTDKSLYVLAGFMLFVLLQGPVSKYIQQIRAARIVQTQAPIPVKVGSIIKKTIPTTMTVSGLIDSEKFIIIKPEFRGKIVYLRDPGECAKGDIIVQLDDSGQKAAVMKAKAIYMEAKDQYDRAILRKSRKEGGISEAEINTLSYRAQSAEGELKKAESELEKMCFKAPFGGIVGVYKPTVSVGAVVMENQELVSISSGDKIVRFSVPEDSLKYVKKGDKVFVTSTAFDETLTATIKATDAKTDSVHSVAVVAKLIADKLSFPSNFAAKVVITTSSEEYLCINESSIISSGRGSNKQSYIYVVVSNKQGEKQAKRVKVSILARAEGQLGVEADNKEVGLTEGVLVVEEVGNRYLDGRILEYEPPKPQKKSDDYQSSLYDLASLGFGGYGSSSASEGASDKEGESN